MLTHTMRSLPQCYTDGIFFLCPSALRQQCCDRPHGHPHAGLGEDTVQPHGVQYDHELRLHGALCVSRVGCFAVQHSHGIELLHIQVPTSARDHAQQQLQILRLWLPGLHGPILLCVDQGGQVGSSPSYHIPFPVGSFYFDFDCPILLQS